MSDTRQAIFVAVDEERDRQERIHGERSIANLPDRFLALACLTEEVGELAHALVEHHEDPAWMPIQKVIDEAVQVAASAVAFVESLHRLANDEMRVRAGDD